MAYNSLPCTNVYIILIQKHISRITKPILGMFELVWMPFSRWIQIWQCHLNMVDIFGKFTDFLGSFCTRFPLESVMSRILDKNHTNACTVWISMALLLMDKTFGPYPLENRLKTAIWHSPNHFKEKTRRNSMLNGVIERIWNHNWWNKNNYYVPKYGLTFVVSKIRFEKLRWGLNADTGFTEKKWEIMRWEIMSQ